MNMSIRTMVQRLKGNRAVLSMVLTLVLLTPINAFAEQAFEQGKIRFAVPPWPGLTVKTRIVSDLFEAIGYRTEISSVGNSIAFQGVANRDIDVFMGYWSPNMDSMVQSYIDDGSVKVIADNVADAESGIAVPQYVWDAGVHSVADLDAHRGRFDAKLYGIEEGSGMNKIYRNAIAKDIAGLGDWNLVASSTSGMLLAVKRAVDRDEWIAWGAWSPHWMMKAFDAHILSNPSEEGLLKNTVTIKTLVSAGFRDFDENAWRLLQQVQLSQSTQSEWIYAYDRQDQPLDQVAREWITNHQATVNQWLEGVRTQSGKPAADAVWDEYQASAD